MSPRFLSFGSRNCVARTVSPAYRQVVRAIEVLPRCSLGFYPTPLVKMERLSERLGGPGLWIKRDDLTGLAFGGNKTRKLEFLMAAAV